MSTTKSAIGTISLVAVMATDQDRSIEFYEALGSRSAPTCRSVTSTAGSRSIRRAAPPASRSRHREPGIDKTGVETGIILTADDIDATHAQLKANGVDVDAEIARMGDPVPPMFWFRDPDGNTLMIVQQS